MSISQIEANVRRQAASSVAENLYALNWMPMDLRHFRWQSRAGAQRKFTQQGVRGLEEAYAAERARISLMGLEPTERTDPISTDSGRWRVDPHRYTI